MLQLQSDFVMGWIKAGGRQARSVGIDPGGDTVVAARDGGFDAEAALGVGAGVDVPVGIGAASATPPEHRPLGGPAADPAAQLGCLVGMAPGARPLLAACAKAARVSNATVNGRRRMLMGPREPCSSSSAANARGCSGGGGEHSSRLN